MRSASTSCGMSASTAPSFTPGAPGAAARQVGIRMPRFCDFAVRRALFPPRFCDFAVRSGFPSRSIPAGPEVSMNFPIPAIPTIPASPMCPP
eukprot:scaffold6253_cov148-Isochrysis_galbana.AAC.2